MKHAKPSSAPVRHRGVSARAVLSVAFLLCLGCAAAGWWYTHPGKALPGRLAALVSAGLFAGVCLRFIRVWTEDWGEPAPDRAGTGGKIPFALLAKIFFAFLAVDAGTVLFIFLLQVINGAREGLPEALALWKKLDSRHYIDIARDWYLREGDWSRLVQLVFLPGYPLAIRLFHLFIRDYLLAGMAVSALCFACSGPALYCLCRLDMDHDAALRVLRYACILPGAFFYAAPMSESLFLVLSLWCVYWGRRGKWVLAGLLGGLAAFTRSLGLILLVPLGYELLTDAVRRRAWKSGRADVGRYCLRLACLMLVPLGFAAYCIICWRVSGDPFRFAEYQQENWGQSLGLFFNTACYQTENALKCFRNQTYEKLIGLWMPNLLCTGLSLTVTLLAARRMRPGYLAYFIAYYAVAIGATWLLSAPRYLLVLFPIPMGLAALTQDRTADSVVSAGCLLMGFVYALAFVFRWQVW